MQQMNEYNLNLRYLQDLHLYQNKYYKKVIKPNIDELEIQKKFLKSEIKKNHFN